MFMTGVLCTVCGARVYLFICSSEPVIYKDFTTYNSALAFLFYFKNGVYISVEVSIGIVIL